MLAFPGMQLQPGKIYAIIGANGSGKSTFAKILAGILPADKKGRYAECASIGYMPQKNYAFRMSTRSNILLNGKDRQQAENLMEALQLTHLADKRADRLSGGETARMALCRLLMRDYEFLLLDEPTAALDPIAEHKMFENMMRAAEGRSVIFISHRLSSAVDADRIYLLEDGRITEVGTHHELMERGGKYAEMFHLQAENYLGKEEAV